LLSAGSSARSIFFARLRLRKKYAAIKALIATTRNAAAIETPMVAPLLNPDFPLEAVSARAGPVFTGNAAEDGIRSGVVGFDDGTSVELLEPIPLKDVVDELLVVVTKAEAGDIGELVEDSSRKMKPLM